MRQGSAKSVRALSPKIGRTLRVSLKHRWQLALLPGSAVHSISATPETYPFVQGNFPDAVKEMTSSIVLATIDIYQTAMASLLPTPTKSHYLFNLRDVSRVMGGLLLLKPSVLHIGALAKAKFARLWVHEILRVFYDRHVSPFCFWSIAALLQVHGRAAHSVINAY